MAESNFTTTVESLFKGMDGFLSTKTIVGEPIRVEDAILLPLMDVSFGCGAGAGAGEKKNSAGGGMSAKMSPSAVLVIQNGTTRLVNIKNQDTITRIIDMAPDLINRFTGKNVPKDETVKDIVEEAAED